MALKGTTRIELTNVKTGEKEVIEKDNLVTNAVGDLLSLNPMGMRLRSYANTYKNTGTTTNTDMYDEMGSSFEAGMLPVCPNAIGGILLYEDALEEDPNKYYAPMDNLLVGYSSNDVNTTESTKRGSMNQNESGALDDGSGYRFVFDFTTAQANGTISAVGMTSVRGGKAGYGDEYDKVGYPMLVVDKVTAYGSATGSPSADDDYFVRNNYVAFDAEKSILYYAKLTNSNAVAVGKLKINLSSVGIMKRTNAAPEVIEETLLETTSFGAVSATNYTYMSKNYNGAFAGTFIDGDDDFIWGFQHEANANGNSSGSASVLWIKISKEDFSFTEGKWSLDAQLFPFGMSAYNNVGLGDVGSKLSWNNAIIKDGRLYALKYDRMGVYSINLENLTDIKLMACDFAIHVGSELYSYYYNGGSTSNHYANFNTNVIELGGVISYLNAYINGGEIHKAGYGTTVSMSPAESMKPSKNKALRCNPMTRAHYGPFFLTYYRYFYRYSSTYEYYRYPVIWLMTPYLATINNLATPVQKTADKTMKITYILREE